MHYQSKLWTRLVRRARSTLRRLLAYLTSARRVPSSPFSRRKSRKQSPPRSPNSEAGSAPPPYNDGLHNQAMALAAELHGQTFRIPDLRDLFKGWPLASNRHAKRLETLVNSVLDKHIEGDKKLRALKKADFAQLISLWYPHAEWDELVAATAYSVWIFVWDDEVDVGDTDVSLDEELTRAYYQRSLRYIRQELGLGDTATEDDNHKTVREPVTPGPNMALFADVGKVLRTAIDKVQRRRFYNELENFMVNVGLEHGQRLRGCVPTLEEYLKIRSGSVGCFPQIAITDYMLKIRLPERIMESAAMRSLWTETVIMCLILNDIYSAQKEIAQGSLLNIVPVMYWNLPADSRSLDTVSSELVSMLQGSMSRFDQASKALDKLTAIEGGDEAEVQKGTRDFVKWCRYFTTGVLYWSLDSRRYGMADCFNKDGSLDIVF